MIQKESLTDIRRVAYLCMAMSMPIYYPMYHQTPISQILQYPFSMHP